MIIAFDSETIPFVPGRAVPEPVCWSFALPDRRNWLLPADSGCAYLEERIDAGDILIAHHAPFDLTVAAEHRPSLLPKIFQALKDGQIRDTKTRQQLADIAVGRRKNPTTKKKEVWRPELGQWVTPDYTLAGSTKVEGSKGLVGLYLGKDRSADKKEGAWRTRYGELHRVPLALYPEDPRRYSLEDAVDTGDVCLAQGKRHAQFLTVPSDPYSLFINELEQNQAAFALKLVSAWGMRTDGPTLDKLEAACVEVIEAARKRLLTPDENCDACRDAKEKDWYCAEHGLFRYQGPKKDPRREITKNSTNLRKRVTAAFTELGLEVPMTKPSTRAPQGQVKTDKDALVLSGDPDLEYLAETGPAHSVKNTFVPALRGGVNVPINTTFDELLDNGRISSSNPNLNNLPRGDVLQKLIGQDVRSAVIPRTGFVFCSVDFDSAELRSHAQINVDLYRKWGRRDVPEMARQYREDSGSDPHLALAARMLRIPLDEAKARKAAGDKDIKAARQAAKAIVFGCPGGLGPAKIVELARKGYGVKMTLAEAKSLKQQWAETWPEMALYLRYISNETEAGEFNVVQHRSGRIRGKCHYTDAANTLWSGKTADGAKLALVNTAFECYVDNSSPLYGSRIVAFLYDELILEVPIIRASRAAARLAEVMISSMRVYLPDIPVTASPALMTRWLKGAEPRYHRGQLVPWDLPEHYLDLWTGIFNLTNESSDGYQEAGSAA